MWNLSWSTFLFFPWMSGTLSMYLFLNPLLIVVFFISAHIRWFLPNNLNLSVFLIQIGKKISLRIWSQSLLKLTNDINRHLKLLFLQDKPFFFFVYDLNSLFHLIIEVKGKSF